MALNHAFIALLPVTLLLLFLTPRPTSSSTVVDVGYGPEDLLSEEQILRLYDTWLAKQGRSYGSLLEKAQRLEVFKENLLYIDSHNRGGQHSYSLGLNRFADMTNEEYHSLYLAGLRMDTPRYLRSPLKNTKSFMYAGVKDVPDSVDWRLKGAVTDVKNQGSCGSCWAFSSIASVEGINQIVTKELVSLSEQELIDCDTAHNEGCNGGMMDNAFDFIISNGGIDTEQDYPYQAKDNQCNANKKNSHIVTIDNFEDVPENDENSLLKAVANQPVSVAIEASSKDFQLYAGGVFDGNCTHDLDHGVAIVGYGTDASGKAYWIVKNSWGQSWGENGYIRMARGLDGSEGLCGINMEPSYPIKKGPNPPAPTPTPPTPPPTPNMCDNQFSCPDSTTCCCIFPWRSMCFAWGCCPMESATCCKDHYHCCPQDYPTCDLGANTCLKKKNDKFGVEMLTRTLATYHGSFPFGWKNNDESRDQGLDIVMMVD